MEKYKYPKERLRGILGYWKGRKMSEKSREKMSVNRIGLKHSEETKRKMSKNHPKYWLGKKRYYKNPKERNEKISKTLIGKYTKEQSPNWKGGITILRTQIYNNFRTRQWRSDIFTRDNFICVLCGKRGGYLEADHYPKMFSTILEEYKIKTLEEALVCEELWDINNGRTLCKKCHNLTKQGRKIISGQ
jgi:hypothetical protein